ncbi:MAG: response regulator transcription factor [Hyphomicrobiales bacterium]|nr:response regulator transcription factor [Hyphomicrobiales bacterium]
MRILVIEDDAVMAAHMAALLAGRDHVATTVADGAEGLARAAAEPWDLIVGDRMLPGLEGLDVVERLRALEVTTPVLIVSALGLPGDRVHGLERGADDYLAKPFADDEFLARVHALLRRSRPEPHPEVLLVGDVEIRVKARTVHRADRHVPLSPKEFELLRCLAEHAGHFVPRSLLLERVWNLRFDPQTNVVDVHVSRLRGKIDDGFATSVIRTSRGEGYMLVTEAS